MKPYPCTAYFVFFFCFVLFSVSDGKSQPAATSGLKDTDNPPIDMQQPYEPGQHPGQMKGLPVIRKMEKGVLSLGEITINKNQGSVMVQGVVNMQEGLVEYLACTAYGKLHESILQLNVNPYYLHIAMLLIGLEPGNKPITSQGAQETPEGDPVAIWVSWKEKDNKLVKYPAEQLVLNKSKNAPMRQTHWIFTGSAFNLDRYMAQVDGSIAAVYHDPYALLDHPLSVGSDDMIFFANKELVPAAGTPVTFTIQKSPEPEQTGQ